MYSVSVIMPVYNNEDTLEEAIQSILNQSIYGLELILINDGSTDSSAQICDKYVKKEPLIVELINLPTRKGFGIARNHGLLKSQGNYIYFANAEDTFDLKMLESNINIADEKETDMVIFGFTKRNEKNSNSEETILPNLPFLASQEQFRRHFRNFYHFYPYKLFNKIYRRDYLLKNRIRFINRPLREDAFFNLSVYKNVDSVAFNRKAFCSPHTNNLLPSFESKDNDYKTNLNLANYLSAIINEWKYEQEFEDLIAKEYVKVVLHELEVISDKTNGYSLEKQLDHLSNLLNDNEIVKYLDNEDVLKDYGPYQRSILASLNDSDIETALQLTIRRNETKSKRSKLKNIVKYLIRGRK